MSVAPAPIDAEARKRGLKRSMGLWMATALVIGNMIGSGIFLLPATMAGEAGPVLILAWVFTDIGAMLLALAGSELGRGRGGPRCMSCPNERDAVPGTF